ncbi:MAG: serine hydrolase [Lachnospiraceae bacterium]|nr:serine hydrolase [Lachnospiraceae bacterium]
MYDDYNYYETDAQEQIRLQRRRARSLEARRRRRIKRRIRWIVTRVVPFCLVCTLILTGIGFGIKGVVKLVGHFLKEEPQVAEVASDEPVNADQSPIVVSMADDVVAQEAVDFDETTDEMPEETVTIEEDETVGGNDSDLIGSAPYYAEKTEYTGTFAPDVLAERGILIDPKTHTIIADKNGTSRMVPASMTKVLTLLVACEHITDLDDTFTLTAEIGDYAKKHDLSIVGFNTDEVVTVRDLLYGTILPSGGDAAMALATYVAGSHEAFVELMNEKVAQLGLSETTHFTNCVGLYDENHYSTCYDIAMIMQAALENDLCRQILTEHIYTTKPTPQHPAGIEISNWFLRRIEDKDCGGEVMYAKTGYVKESGYCAVSFAQGPGEQPYICVTTNSGSSWKCIYDHVRIYSAYFKLPG